jgi:nucleosome binding factor SPN SPT16 subunit
VTCSESEIPHAEGKLNLNWGDIMKHVNSDVLEFFNEGGWIQMFPEEGANEEEDEDEEESEYEGEEEEEESSESESEYSDDDDSGGSSEDGGSEIQTPDESEDEGDDWSDLEEKAAKCEYPLKLLSR